MMPKLKSDKIAQEYNVTSGPSVFYARSLYWNCTNNVVWEFADNCLYQTGFYKTNPEDFGHDFNLPSYFKIYPNPLPESRRLVIESGDFGFAILYNTMGQESDSFNIKKGMNFQYLKDMSAGVWGYKVKLESGQVYFGKLIIVK